MKLDIKVGRLRLVNVQAEKDKFSMLQASFDKARETLDNALRHERTEGRKQYFNDEMRNRFLYLSDMPLARKRLERLISLVVPHQVNRFHKIRLGRPHDGGYVCIDDFAVDGALSLGISDDVSWDSDAAKRGIPIHQYDHTVSGPPVFNQAFTFHKERIGTASDGGVSLGEACKRANIYKSASAILKIDIEHAEWPVFDATSDDALSRFSQIVGEFHGFDEVLNDAWYEQATRVFTKLSKQFRLVHVHGNNLASQIVLGSKLLPRCMEMTFANVSRYELSPANERFPTPLDMPNNPDKPEHYLDDFKL